MLRRHPSADAVIEILPMTREEESRESSCEAKDLAGSSAKTRVVFELVTETAGEIEGKEKFGPWVSEWSRTRG